MNGSSIEISDTSEKHELELSRESSKIEQEALERKIKLGKAQEHVISLIQSCKHSGARYLDLTKKNISVVPDELLSLTHLEVSYCMIYSTHVQT